MCLHAPYRSCADSSGSCWLTQQTSGHTKAKFSLKGLRGFQLIADCRFLDRFSIFNLQSAISNLQSEKSPLPAEINPRRLPAGDVAFRQVAHRVDRPMRFAARHVGGVVD